MDIKNYIKIVLLIVGFGLVASCSQTSDRSKLKLKGKVASLTVTNYLAEQNSGEWETTKMIDRSKIFFDKKGWQQSSEYYNDLNELTQRVTLKRKNGKVQEQSIFSADGQLLMKDAYTYHSNDTIKTITYDAKGEVLLTLKSVYDNDLIVRQDATNIEEGYDSQFIIIYEYDNRGNEICKEWSNPEMQQFSVEKSEYDQKGNLIFKEINEVALESSSTTEYEYLLFDSKGNWTKRLEQVAYEDEEGKGEYTLLGTREYKYY